MALRSRSRDRIAFFGGNSALSPRKKSLNEKGLMRPTNAGIESLPHDSPAVKSGRNSAVETLQTVLTARSLPAEAFGVESSLPLPSGRRSAVAEEGRGVGRAGTRHTDLPGAGSQPNGEGASEFPSLVGRGKGRVRVPYPRFTGARVPRQTSRLFHAIYSLWHGSPFTLTRRETSLPIRRQR